MNISNKCGRAPRIVAALLASIALFAFTLPGWAQDSDWLAVPTSGDFNIGANWSSGVPTDTAFFGASTTTNLTISATTTLDGWTFNPGALAYTFTNSHALTFTGAGLVFNGGSATIVTNNGGTTAFTGNASGGAAHFIVNTGGALDISGAAGAVSVGSIEGAGTVFLSDKELIVGGNNRSTIFGGIIFDVANSGMLTKTGTGTLTLTGNNTYTGITNVDGGTLLVNGSIASSLMLQVNPGATLGGTGIVPFTLLDDGATLAPGTPASIGTLTVNDRVVFCACSIFAVKVSSTGSDSVNVVAGGLSTGDAFLEGAVRVSSPTGTYRFNSPYTILATAGSINGTQFDTLVLPTGVSGALGYTANDVTLTLSSALGQTTGLSGNQQRVANVLDAAFNANGGTGALNGVFGGDLNAKLGQLVGQPATGLAPAGLQMTGSFLNTMLHPTGAATNGGPLSGGAVGFAAEPQPSPEVAAAFAAVTPKDRRAALAPVDPSWSVWGQFYGGQRTADGDAAAGTADTTTRTYGVATGFDYRASVDMVVGLALAGGSTNYSLADGLGGGKSDVFQLGVYGTKKFGAAYLSAALSYAWHNASTDRTVTVSGIDKLVADFSAHSFGGRLEGGYRVDTAILSVTPYAAVQVQAFRTSAYTETAALGSNAFSLSYDARTVNATRTELGAWVDRTVALDGGAAVTWRGRVAWAHDFNNDQSVNAVFQTLPGASFTVNGAQPGANAALLSAGAELRLVNHWSVAAKFDGEFASGARTYAGTGTLRYVW